MSVLEKEKDSMAEAEQFDFTPEMAGEDVVVKPNRLNYHAEQPRSPEEIKAERRFVRKVDLWILPLLSLMYFLASLVSASPAAQKTAVSPYHELT